MLPENPDMNVRMKRNVQGSRFVIPSVTRRQMLAGLGILGSTAVFGTHQIWQRNLLAADPSSDDRTPVPTRLLGKTGGRVSMMALGGAHFIRRSEKDGLNIAHEAIDLGVTFFDNAWEYNDTRSETVMGKALKGKRDRVFLMTKVCTHGRGKAVALRQLEQSLRRLGTDYLDLWQIHEVNCQDDHDILFAQGGVAEALLQAKQEGKVRFVGFTGHKDPAVHARVLKQHFPFDTCQMPLNVFDASFRSFEQLVLPELLRQGIAPIAMKTLCGKGQPIKEGVVRAEEALRYVWSLPVATIVSGVDSVDLLRENAGYARRFVAMKSEDMAALRARVAAYADGRFEGYKTGASWSCDRQKVEERFGPLDRT